MTRTAADIARRERYRGRCEVCGAPTDGSKGPGKAPRRCYRHSPALANVKLRGKGPKNRKIIEYLEKHPTARAIELLRASDYDKQGIKVAIQRLLAYNLIERVDLGVYRLVKQQESQEGAE